MRVEVLEPAHRLAQPSSADLPPLETGIAVRQEGQHLPRSRDAWRRRCVEGRSARLRLRRGRRRPVRQCVPAAETAAQGLRRSHSQFAARRRRRARRVRRRRARGTAADRRDAVQRFRRDRIQSARQQRREDSLSVGRRRADGRAHAVGRPSSCRPVSQPEHRAVVLSHAGPEDRRAVDARRRARVDGRRRRRSRSGSLLRAHRALSRPTRETGPRRGEPSFVRPDSNRQGRATEGRQRHRDDFVRRLRPSLHARRRKVVGGRHRGSACSICAASRRSTRTRSSP